MSKKPDDDVVDAEGEDSDILISWRKRRRSSVGEKGVSSKLVRIVEGTAGKEWECEAPECEKRFKTVSLLIRFVRRGQDRRI